MDRTTKQLIANKALQEVAKCYDAEQAKLYLVGKQSTTEGEIREAAGNLVEHILQNIFDTIDFLSKNINYKGKNVVFGQIQVDRHVFSRGNRICFIENKTYLDSCYYDRALADFRKIAQSLAQHGQDPADCKYIVFAGQNAASYDTLFTYEADFWNDTKNLTKNPDGLETKTFFFLQGKRNSKTPLYKVKHPLDFDQIRNFVFFILDLL